MERISDAGVLYLEDYQILTEAKNEVERFLNAIVEAVTTSMRSEEDNLCSDHFAACIWKNQSSLGHLEVIYENLQDNHMFRKEKVDLYIIYKDIRNVDDIAPNAAKVYVWSPKVASKLEQRLRKLSLEKWGEDLYEPTIIDFDLKNSVSTAEKIVNEMINKNDMIEKLMREIEE